jgi:hypothetical protein
MRDSGYGWISTVPTSKRGAFGLRRLFRTKNLVLKVFITRLSPMYPALHSYGHPGNVLPPPPQTCGEWRGRGWEEGFIPGPNGSSTVASTAPPPRRSGTSSG